MNTLQLKSFKVLLIGDSCIDEYVYGTCERLNPEAPVPILKYVRTEKRHGMAWNVRENLLSFNIDVYMITQQEKIIKTRYIDERSNQQILRVDKEDIILPMTGEIPDQDWDAIVISDYNKGFVTKEILFDVVEKSLCPVFIDSKKTDLPLNNCYIKINDIEYKKLSSANNNLIVTKGSDGAVYKDILYPGEKVNVYDVVGAGDTFLSALTYFYLTCGTIEDAIPYANKAAAIAVQNFGTYVLSKEDANELCN